MNRNEEEETGLRLLETLYELARGDIAASPKVLTEWVGGDERELRVLLTRLDAQGLVDAETCRLTMRGLVLAVSMAGSRKVARDAA
ncbi:MAG: hypothetical protein AAF436_07210 [Myxococcota bacterium]